jgi:hypothetical protein
MRLGDPSGHLHMRSTWTGGVTPDGSSYQVKSMVNEYIGRNHLKIYWKLTCLNSSNGCVCSGYYQCLELESFIKSWQSHNWSRYSSPFMESGSSLPYQDSYIETYASPVEPCAHTPNIFKTYSYVIVLPSSWTNGFSFVAGPGFWYLSPEHLGSHPASHQMATGINLPGCETVHSSRYSFKIKNVWSHTFIPPIFFTV